MLNDVPSMIHDFLKSQKNAIERERLLTAELKREREKSDYLRAEIEILRSRSPSLNALVLKQQKDEISTPSLDNKEVQDLLQAEHKDADLQFITKRRAHLRADELSRAEQLVNDRKYRAWFMSLESEKLLILWNQRQPMTHAGISPISVFCASLEPILNSDSRFTCLTWFCGLHSKHGNDEARAMLADLIVQLRQRHHFDFGREYDDTNKSLLRERDPVELYTLFYRLIRSVPRKITVVILIDEAYVYESDGFQDGINVFHELMRLVTDATIQSVIKLLFTSTRRVEFLNEEFQQGDLTLHVETAAHQRGGPSQRRMERQTRPDSDQGGARETLRESEREYYERDDF
ncbi:hypothetical protein THARTR1_00691 [Trichoderma harzianum]|uniref:Uncharacterized protein n=1 Tax=Trichoderma harzianum TaxID=5544 RepID=A0A2K0UPY2_TRIHA|nr:hypothetical protein THARTR1_00691 [Trichoderma harzianum]